MKASEFKIAVNKVYTNYSHKVNEVAFNLLDSHDTTRLLTVCDNNKQKALLAYTFEMTQTGTPCIYYGGEIGLDGGADPLCRKCMIWDEESQDRYMYDYLKKLISIRRNYPTMRSYELEWIETNDKQNYVIFKKHAGTEELVVFLNNNATAQTISVPSNLKQNYYELLTDKQVNLAKDVTVEPYSALLLVPITK